MQHIPEIEIDGCAAGERAVGRRTFLARTGEAVYVEQLALQYYESNDCKGLWTENEFWWQIMTLLYWDVVYAPVPGVYYPEMPFPGEAQDLPRDMFTGSFYEKRARDVQKRHGELQRTGLFGRTKERPAREIQKAWRKHHGKPCRLMGVGEDSWSRYSSDQLVWGVSQLSSTQVVAICDRLLRDFTTNRPGIPDLFLCCLDRPKFVEVKQFNESIKPGQAAWHEYLTSEAKIDVEICRVRKVKQL